MTVVLVVVQILMLITLGVLLLRVRRLRTRALDGEHLLSQTDGIEIGPRIADGGGRLITVEILNPLEVAAKRVRLASVAGSVAPDLIGKVVYEQTARIMRRQLEMHGVEAEVRIHADD